MVPSLSTCAPGLLFLLFMGTGNVHHKTSSLFYAREIGINLSRYLFALTSAISLETFRGLAGWAEVSSFVGHRDLFFGSMMFVP